MTGRAKKKRKKTQGELEDIYECVHCVLNKRVESGIPEKKGGRETKGGKAEKKRIKTQGA